MNEIFLPPIQEGAQYRTTFEVQSTQLSNMYDAPITGTVVQLEEGTSSKTTGQVKVPSTEPSPIRENPQLMTPTRKDNLSLFIHMSAIQHALLAENAALIAQNAHLEGSIFP